MIFLIKNSKSGKNPKIIKFKPVKTSDLLGGGELLGVLGRVAEQVHDVFEGEVFSEIIGF